MCQECSVLQSAHRNRIQIYLHLTARKNRPGFAPQIGAPEPVARDVDAALAEAASGINEAWQRLVEHQARHSREATLSKLDVSFQQAQI